MKSTKKKAPKKAPKKAQLLTADERAVLRETVQDLKAGKTEGEGAVLAKIAALKGSDRALAERIHAIVKANAPTLTPKTWYGMPAYAKDDKVVCFFQSAQKFKARYATLGFNDKANLDDGRMWPIAFAVTELTAAEEAKIAALLKKAVS